MKCTQSSCCIPRLSVCALGFAVGVTWALGVCILGILVWQYQQGAPILNNLASLYMGYGPTPKGIAIGSLWALVDGFICGALVAWLYNLCKHACHCCCRQKSLSGIEVKSLNHPDEERNLPKTKIQVVNIGKYTVMKATFEPGWKWSECVKPTVGTKSCQAPHVNYIIAGKMKIVMDNGAEKEVGPGDALFIAPGHDAWVLGNEPCVAIDFTAGQKYGKR